MTREEVTEKFHKMLKKEYCDHYPKSCKMQLCDETNFVEDLGMDSLDLVETIMATEEYFDVEIDDHAAERISTIGDAVEMLVNISV